MSKTTTRGILGQRESREALDAGRVRNGDCETPGAVALPDGNVNAERVMVIKRRGGGEELVLCSPWLLSDLFSV